MCVGVRSDSNPGSLGREPSALTNCASCPLVVAPHPSGEGGEEGKGVPKIIRSLMPPPAHIRSPNAHGLGPARIGPARPWQCRSAGGVWPSPGCRRPSPGPDADRWLGKVDLCAQSDQREQLKREHLATSNICAGRIPSTIGLSRTRNSAESDPKIPNPLL